MIGRRVVAPDGRVWRVRRRWLPWEPRLRRPRFNFDGGFDGGFAAADLFDGPGAFVVGLLLFLAVGILAGLLFPVLLVVGEVLIALVLLPLFVVLRLVLGEPWILLATTWGPPAERRLVRVDGWRASRNHLRDMTAAVEAGLFDRPHHQ